MLKYLRSISFDNNFHNSYKLKMDSLLKASENFEQVNFDEKIFLNFMKQVAIWEYFGLSKSDYVALPEPEKRVKICQYYSDMKSKGVGEFFFVYLFV